MSTNIVLAVEDHLESHIQHLRAAGRSPDTYEKRREIICRVRRDLGVPLSDATTQQLARWLARPGWSRATRHNYRYHLRSYLAWLAAAGLAERDPSVGLARVLPPKGLPRPVPDHVLAEILGRARNPWRLYILIAAYAGLRCAEIAGLDRADITQHEITVLGKGNKVRVVDTHPEIWRAVVGLPPGPIAHFAASSPERPGRVMSRVCTRYLTRMGYKGLTLHQFRHSFATRLLRAKEHGGAGANIRIVQVLLGHASLTSTEIYTLVTSEERRLAVNALPAVA